MTRLTSRLWLGMLAAAIAVPATTKSSAYCVSSFHGTYLRHSPVERPPNTNLELNEAGERWWGLYSHGRIVSDLSFTGREAQRGSELVMAEQVSRRVMAKLVGTAVAGVVVAIGAGEDVAAAGVAGRRSPLGRVIAQRRVTARVKVSPGAVAASPASTVVDVPVVGFPPDWQLRLGDRVIVTHGGPDEPVAAHPLVTRVVGSLERVPGRAGEVLVAVGGVRVRVQAATIGAGPAQVKQGSDRTYEAYYIDNDLDGVRSCVTLRPVG